MEGVKNEVMSIKKKFIRKNFGKKGELRAVRGNFFEASTLSHGLLRVRSMYISGRRKGFSRLGKNLAKMGRKNRGNSKFWSQKKFFPPGTRTRTLRNYNIDYINNRLNNALKVSITVQFYIIFIPLTWGLEFLG